MEPTKESEEIKIETPEERRRRLQKQRLRQERRRRRRRKAIMMRIGTAAVVVLLVIGLIWAVVSGVRKKTGKEQNETGEEQQEIEVLMEQVKETDVLFLSFQSLIVDSEKAFSQENTQAAATMEQERLTVEEFQQVLQQLYDKGYVLISMKDLVRADEDGIMKIQELFLPQGKKPLMICQQNVNYAFGLSEQGTASRLVVDESGKIKAEKKNSDGTASVGDYDVIPCLDTFIEEHPDFAYNNAKGILGLTGYNGVLGYRTDSSLAVSAENRYAAQYGVFDTEAEIENAKPVIAALRQEGWEFACNGYAFTSYTEDVETVKADMQLWMEQVENFVGQVDISLYPNGTDIKNWNAYSNDDEKYSFLKEQGFRYFCSLDMSGNWAQMTEEYFRCSYRSLDGYRMYQDVYEGAGRFQDIFSFEEIMDQSRPAIIQKAEEAGSEDQEI